MALTPEQQAQADKNKAYWAKREEEALKHYIKDEAEYDKEIDRIYKSMLDSVQNEINAFYGRYADKEDITIAEAKKRVSKADIEAYERKAKRYVRDKDFSAEANEEMRLYNLMMKVNRLEMLKANIGLELIAGHDELQKFMGKILQGRTEEELARQAGILGKTIKNNAQLAHSIVNASFHNAKYSDRIWLYQDLLRQDLDKLLQTGLIQGKNPRALARELKAKFGASTYNAERLMRTELARVQTDAQKKSFERNGFDKYIFIVNASCCDICHEVAKRKTKHGVGVYLVSEMMPGDNAPPVHPHCRCSTAAYEDSKEYEAWLNYLESGGTTAEWDKMSAKERKMVAKSSKKNKIKVKNISEECKKLIEMLKKNKVSYREVSKHKKPLSNNEIVEALAGGDLTRGSCASVGLAYIGQKGGLNVLDFRDGESRNFFSMRGILRQISTLPGVKTHYKTARSSVTAGNQLLKEAEKGKEYYLVCGRHAAIVRKNDDDILQYLELQSAYRSGWTDFDGNPRYTLKHRFGETKAFGMLDDEAFMIEVDSFKDSEDLHELLGYINTADEEQRKGKHGTIK